MSVVKKYKSLLDKGKAIISMFNEEPNKAAIVQESSTLIKEFTQELYKINKLKGYIVIDPISSNSS